MTNVFWSVAISKAQKESPQKILVEEPPKNEFEELFRRFNKSHEHYDLVRRIYLGDFPHDFVYDGKELKIYGKEYPIDRSSEESFSFSIYTGIVDYFNYQMQQSRLTDEFSSKPPVLKLPMIKRLFEEYVENLEKSQKHSKDVLVRFAGYGFFLIHTRGLRKEHFTVKNGQITEIEGFYIEDEKIIFDQDSNSKKSKERKF